MHPRIAIVLKGYPRLSETFIAQEIRALEKRGFRICLFSLRHPYDPATHPIHAEIEAPVHYLPEYLHDDWWRVFRAWIRVRRMPGYPEARRRFLRDFARDRTRNRLRRFGQALVMAAELPATVEHLYAHFMHTPASVTCYTSLMRSMPWSLSAHAKDIYTIPEWEILEKLASLDWLVTCTGANASYLGSLQGGDKVSLLYHGLDFDRFDQNRQPASKRDGSETRDPVVLISVGRAVDKKGYEFLLEALASLPADLRWRFFHIGGGELLERLKAQARSLGIDDSIEWLGALPQTEVLQRYRQADLFVLPSKISDDGDRDGLPNVLMEAQSQHLACLSTDISGIPELIVHGETGWLVPQRDAAALAQALEQLIRDWSLRRRLAEAGFDRVRSDFAMDKGIDQLSGLLADSLAKDSKP